MSEPQVDKNKVSQNSTIVGVVVNNSQDGQEDHPDISALKSLFKITLETRNFEISQLVQRNNFFMIFQGVLLSGLIQSSHSKPVVSFMVCLAGFLVSAYQIKMAAGAKFWQEYWEQALNEVEKELMSSIQASTKERQKIFYLFHDDAHVYNQMVTDRLNRHGHSLINKIILKRYSVSRVPICVAIILSIIWLTLLFCTLRAYPPLCIPSFIVGF